MTMKEFSSLLTTITSQEVDDLIIEEKLKTAGYNFHYIVDTFDLSNYCFPLGLTKEVDDDPRRKSFTIDDKLDEHITFDILFTKKDKYFYLLNEHLDEFYDFQLAVNHAKDYGLKLVNTHKELLESFNKKKYSPDTLDLLYNIEEFKLSLLLSIAIGYLREGIQKLNILRVEDKNLILDLSEQVHDETVRFVMQLISEVEPHILSQKIYDLGSLEIQNLKNKTEYYKQNRKLKLLNDSEVVDRVVNINRQLLKQKKHKILCLYISSTSKSLNWFQKQIKKERDSKVSKIEEDFNIIIKQHLPSLTLNNEKMIFNPHRSSSQLFLSLILDEANSNEKIENLLKFKKSIENNNQSSPYLKINIEEFLKRRISLLREKFENYALLSQFDKFKKTLKEAQSQRKVKKYKELASVIDHILKNGQKLDEINKLKEQNFRVYYYEKSFRSLLNLGLKKLNRIIKESQNDNRSLVSLITEGDDPVSGRYHILPIVFFINDNEIKKILNNYTKLIISSNVFKTDKENYLKSINKTLNSIIKERKRIKNDSNLIKLMGCLLLLLLPESDKNDKLVLNRIKEIIDYELKPEDDDIRAEFYYTAAWVARRIKDYVSADKFATRGISKSSKDPRFKHSFALNNYCKSFGESGKIKIKLLNDSIKYSKEAIRLYREIEHRSIENKKSEIALINTIIYSQCLIYDEIKASMKKDYSSLIFDARTFLNNKLKQLEKNYSSFYEFLHTEAFLELMETNYLMTKDQYEKAHNKILFAQYDINSALKLNPNDKDCIELQNRILQVSDKVYSIYIANLQL